MQITFRQASNNDITNIVGLLKIALGESIISKTNEYWRWKHVDNPFGESPVIIAEKAGQLIGVRAFMCWNWRYKDQVFKSLRAVDTAIHPDYHGKGIFKKLTMQLVDKCINDGYDFIFNTPNEKSMPGYLKMDWQKIGRYPIKISLISPLKIFFFTSKSDIDSIELDSKKSNQIVSQDFLNSCIATMSGSITTTDYSIEYLKWRYIDVPGQKYFIESCERNGWYVFYRKKVNNRRKELRVCDVFLSQNFDERSLQQFIGSEGKRLGMNVITSNSINFNPSRFSIQLKIGPELVFRKLNMKITPNNWLPVIGDIELF